MLVVLAVVLAVLRAFTSQHLLHGGSNRLLRICNRMVRRMVGEPKASEPIVDILRPEIRLGHPQAAPDLIVGG
jgi:hypothetical protein